MKTVSALAMLLFCAVALSALQVKARPLPLQGFSEKEPTGQNTMLDWKAKHDKTGRNLLRHASKNINGLVASGTGFVSSGNPVHESDVPSNSFRPAHKVKFGRDLKGKRKLIKSEAEKGGIPQNYFAPRHSYSCRGPGCDDSDLYGDRRRRMLGHQFQSGEKPESGRSLKGKPQSFSVGTKEDRTPVNSIIQGRHTAEEAGVKHTPY